MDKNVARYVVGLIANDIDARRPKGMRCLSSYELEKVEELLCKNSSDKAIKFSDWVTAKLMETTPADYTSHPVENENSKADTDNSRPP